MKYLAAIALSLAALLSSAMTQEEKKALDFLYSTMALPDSVDYTQDFYLENIRSTFRAREEMPWGKMVPDREFRHFVLPVRVNNEDLDMSRPVMYDELKDRVKNLSMADAILEVNHWCHEKATYKPSDSRTNSPFATMRSALGRCGEESTFTVAALRSVGIPARQVYTPRWAHTDDNHAWVEAWADGKWHFLGACEPEAVLDLAWFNEPASRGMLMNTKVAGQYDGPEEVLETNAINTIINVTENYAPTGTVEVTVVDADGKPVEGARTAFCLYNYAEFFPVAVKTSDASGKATLLAGLGDMIVWASDGSRFGLAKVSAAHPGKVVLTYGPDYEGVADFDIVPPAARASAPAVTEAQRALNERRKAYEDSVRMAYTSTFYNKERSSALAADLGVDAARLEPLMTGSRGNHDIIEAFLRNLPADRRNDALTLLEQLSEKDLNDITPEVLADHLATPPSPTPLHDAYIVNPRVDRERLTPYKSLLANAVDGDPERWVTENITIDANSNPLRFRMSPEGVWRHRTTDAVSRSIFFVALCRSMGIPARIDPVTGKTQRADANGEWLDVKFGAGDEASAPKGFINLVHKDAGAGITPRYYSHFTLSKIEDGVPVLQNYPEDATLAGMSASPLEVDAGQYVLVTGQRMADGSVLSKARFFTVPVGTAVDVDAEFRHNDQAVEVIGNFNSEDMYYDAATDTEKSILSTTGRGYYVLGLIEPSHEPSAHALNDISALASELDAKGIKMLLLLPDKEALGRFDATLYPSLPSCAVIGSDIDGAIASEIVANMELTEAGKPLFIVADTFNRVVFLRRGYNIGLGEELLRILSSTVK